MIKNVLTHIGGVGVYGVVSILIFISVFIGVSVWMLCMKKSYYTSMELLPLEDSELRPSSDGHAPNQSAESETPPFSGGARSLSHRKAEGGADRG